jgi:NAD(P)-dependent dehydrogenase (short-subunit alcohol dehydrogenase family)
MKKKKAIVIVTGVKINEAKKIFKRSNPATLIPHKGKQYKMNAAAGAAVALNRAGYIVYMTGSCNGCMKLLGKTLLKKPYHFTELNLLDKNAIVAVVKEVKKLQKKTGLPVHLVHYGGASETDVKLPGNSIFLDPWETPSEAVAPIVANNTVTWFNILQGLRSVFASQKITKVVLISAITALRTKRLHALDAIQKGAGHAMARSLALDLTPENIFITEIMPGITDTGFYDNPKTLKYIKHASKELGYDYTDATFPVFSAERAGEAVVFAMDVDAHVREITLMPFGQYPHLGA